MNTCQHCGEVIPENAVYCPSCGYKATPEACCPQCQSPIRPSDRFCMKCGTPLSSGTPSSLQTAGTSSANLSPDSLYANPYLPFASSKTTCPSCGASVPDTSRICPECGCMLAPSKKKMSGKTEGSIDSPPVHAPKNKRLVTAIVIIAILLVFLLTWTITQRHAAKASFSPDTGTPVPAEEVTDDYGSPNTFPPSGTEEDDTDMEEVPDN